MIINLASKLPGERDYLLSALNDFSLDGARNKYAAWLEENGDTKRSHIIRATIKALQRISSN